MSDLMFILISSPPGPLGDDAEEELVLLAQLHVQSELLPRQGLPWVPPLTLVVGPGGQHCSALLKLPYFFPVL